MNERVWRFTISCRRCSGKLPGLASHEVDWLHTALGVTIAVGFLAICLLTAAALLIPLGRML
ncbi:MAG: hypothetical protein CMJ18_08480 [Phycisphaeraceae bacterium]|nr:hypothetical protein [Phycisphaeraceae bacterium]